ncbi:Ppx/GppA family phosphatase [Lichenihabitans sp. PAMC28606]|uniref:Ppx/GppA family phosphatase n=1 Tax=Lichenihabitans sp. PAMC28606 TaxID=2880932 RepID=UPI00222259ED|nr:Ppx/GppA phosphatase family protein [Lichenihabitans sp. PAMC28606]
MTVVHPAPGRLAGSPVAIVDIGSNSVRLVAYESLSRALTPIFNEKVLCGLGKGVATTGVLAQDAIDKALAALRCFRVMCRNMEITDIFVLATAATRDASNGQQFLEFARAAIGTDIALIGGLREAELSAKGVISGFHQPDGIVGDLGGGSLELVDVRGTRIGSGISLPIGGLALSDLSKNSPKRAVKIVRDALAAAAPLKDLKGRTFYAVGGTWRALAALHMRQRDYPLHVMHGYVIPGNDPEIFSSLIEPSDTDAAASLATVSASRRPLLGFGAVVLEEVIRIGKPKDVVVSTLGVREGMLFERLSEEVRRKDALLQAAAELNALRSRNPRHGHDLTAWTDELFTTGLIEETVEQKRLRHAACLLSDTAWRAHPDYRSAQAFSTIANAAFVGIDHPGRGFLALAINYRYEGLDGDVNAQLRSLVLPAGIERAKLIGAILRVAIQVSSAMGGVLPRAPLRCGKSKLTLTLPRELADLATVRLNNRLKQVAKLLGREAEIKVED